MQFLCFVYLEAVLVAMPASQTLQNFCIERRYKWFRRVRGQAATQATKLGNGFFS